MALKTVVRTDNNESFKFEKKNTTLKGYYLKTVVKPINGKDCNVHIFQTSKGLVSVLGQHDLSQQLLEVTKGCYVEATYTHTIPLKGGKTMKVFKLGWDDTDSIDAGSAPTDDGDEPEAEEPAEEETEAQSDEEEEPADDAEEEVPMDEVKTAPARSLRPTGTAIKGPSKVDSLLSKNRKAS